MDLKTKIYVLNQIYNLYDRFSAGVSVACERSCCHCCTGNVTLTTLEGYVITDDMIGSNQTEILNKLDDAKTRQRFQPKMTTNMLANLCAKGQAVPDEDNDATWGECPLLKRHECPIYRMRPFGCRCFVSESPCGDTGCAAIDPFVLSVNTLFLQFIEHIDSDGYSANLIDMLSAMRTESLRAQYRKSGLKTAPDAFIPNRHISVFFIPPDHRQKIAPILKSLQGIRVPA